MKPEFDQDELDRMQNDPDNYKWGFFYFNRNDPRLFIPRKTGIGMSLNFGHPFSFLIIIGFILFALLMGNFDKFRP